MRPIRTPETNAVYNPAEGDEDHVAPLFVTAKEDDPIPSVASTWELTDEEREQIAQGAHILLGVATLTPPPVGLAVVPPFDGEEFMEWSDELKSFVRPVLEE